MNSIRGLFFDMLTWSEIFHTDKASIIFHYKSVRYLTSSSSYNTFISISSSSVIQQGIWLKLPTIVLQFIFFINSKWFFSTGQVNKMHKIIVQTSFVVLLIILLSNCIGFSQNCDCRPINKPVRGEDSRTHLNICFLHCFDVKLHVLGECNE